jgi:hypothetical protein
LINILPQKAPSETAATFENISLFSPKTPQLSPLSQTQMHFTKPIMLLFLTNNYQSPKPSKQSLHPHHHHQ